MGSEGGMFGIGPHARSLRGEGGGIFGGNDGGEGEGGGDIPLTDGGRRRRRRGSRRGRRGTRRGMVARTMRFRKSRRYRKSRRHD